MSQNNSTQVWPSDGLESVKNCPICRNGSRQVIHSDLSDEIFACAPGKWTMHQCDKCETAYLDPRPTADTIQLAYDNYYTHESVPINSVSGKTKNKSLIKRILKNWIVQYENYNLSIDDDHKKPTLGRFVIMLLRPLASYLDATARHIKATKDKKYLLDIASGSGDFLIFAKKAGWEVEGIEFDPKAVDVSRSLGLNVALGSVNSLSDYKTSYDLITASHIVEHIHAPVALLENCFRLLKPGGKIWIETPNINSLGHKRFSSKWRGLEPPRHLVIFSKKSLKNVLISLGYRKIKFHNRGLNTVPTYATSQIVKQGALTVKEQFKYSLSFKYWLDILTQYINSNRREFLTITAEKPEL